MDKVSPEPNSGCWLWIGAVNEFGYGVTGKGRAHRISYEQHKGVIPAGLCILHKCDVPSCVNPDHLFAGTKRDNLVDMYRKGRGRPPRGEGCHNHRLTEAQVCEIRSSDKSARFLGAKYGVSHTAIIRIKSRRKWAHVGR